MPAVGQPKNRTRQYKDPSELTPYEQRIYDLRSQGLTWKEIAERLGNKHNGTIAQRYNIIMEKLGSRG